MNQDRAVGLTITSLKLLGQHDTIQEKEIRKQILAEIRPFLNQLYVAGWEEYRKWYHTTNERAIVLKNKNGEILKEFSSIVDASRKTKISYSTISSAIYQHRKRRDQSYWEFKEITPQKKLKEKSL